MSFDEVVALERRLLAPATRASSGELERLLHADFREIGASGAMWDRASIIAALAVEPPRRIAVTDMAARRIAPGVVLVTYAAASEAGRSLHSSLWVQGEDGWRLLFHQGTPA